MTEEEMAGWHHRLDGHGFGCFRLFLLIPTMTIQALFSFFSHHLLKRTFVQGHTHRELGCEKRSFDNKPHVLLHIEL